ncbi:hypothetical protein [Segatella bryantii]|jgi:hypothetical protein|uniref:hypothetical protein n=1 Tax=Segatella bryantii TaxID=77095 RepID=UPI00241CB710|nr:hypothetical protein [Segatella bryantii]
MKDVFFDPWVGSCYNSGINGKKIMIMGHVHVCSDCIECGNIKDRDEECASFTKKVVKDYIKWRETGEVPSPGYEGWLRTYFNFAKAFFGYEPNFEQEKCELWDKVLFYNYVQRAVADWNQKPNSEAYEKSQAPFMEVINEYEPDVIIVWGKDAFNGTPGGGKFEESITFEDIMAKRYIYTLNSGKQCSMIKIHHPSMCFSSSKWHEIIKSIIEEP